MSCVIHASAAGTKAAQVPQHTRILPQQQSLSNCESKSDCLYSLRMPAVQRRGPPGYSQHEQLSMLSVRTQLLLLLHVKARCTAAALCFNPWPVNQGCRFAAKASLHNSKCLEAPIQVMRCRVHHSTAQGGVTKACCSPGQITQHARGQSVSPSQPLQGRRKWQPHANTAQRFPCTILDCSCSHPTRGASHTYRCFKAAAHRSAHHQRYIVMPP